MSMDELRVYVALSQDFQPYVPEDLTEYVATAYTEMRLDESRAAQHATVSEASVERKIFILF
jgi:DNA replicative helicase MCM subunit Mcm2 (Cdc46/Mcm family)